MTQVVRDVFEVFVPIDLGGEQERLGQSQAIAEARNASKIYAIPATWECSPSTESDGDHEVYHVSRYRNLPDGEFLSKDKKRQEAVNRLFTGNDREFIGIRAETRRSVLVFIDGVYWVVSFKAVYRQGQGSRLFIEAVVDYAIKGGEYLPGLEPELDDEL